MNAAADPMRASVQMAVMRAPTTSLIDAVAAARRRRDAAKPRDLGGSPSRLVAAAA